jgi:hypothetical protein
MSVTTVGRYIVRGYLVPMVVWVAYPATVSAQASFLQQSNAVSPLACGTIAACLNIVLDAVVLLVFPIIVLMIVYTGFLFVVAQGNSSKLEAARKALLWTVVGALVVLGAKALSLAIEATVLEIKANASKCIVDTYV